MITGNWVLIDETRGAKTSGGNQLSYRALENIAEAVTRQLKEEFAAEHGVGGSVRAAKDKNDVQPGEWVYAFIAEFPKEDAGDSAYHDINGQGVPVAYCAVTTCVDLYGPAGVSVDASHEILETACDPGANLWAWDDDTGNYHALEVCDAVEMQTYGKTCKNGTVVQVSNWLLRSFFVPNAAAPFDYMSKAGLPGAVAPPGPMQTAPSKSGEGNYQLIWAYSGEGRDATSYARRITGTRRKGEAHWSSRVGRRLKA